MKSGKTPRIIALISLSLALSAALLTGCAIKIKAITDCAWAEKIVISEATLDYLIRPEAPETVVDEMNDIADHNELLEKNCQ